MTAQNDRVTPAEHTARLQVDRGRRVVLAAGGGYGWLQAVIEPPARGDTGPDPQPRRVPVRSGQQQRGGGGPQHQRGTGTDVDLEFQVVTAHRPGGRADQVDAARRVAEPERAGGSP